MGKTTKLRDSRLNALTAGGFAQASLRVRLILFALLCAVPLLVLTLLHVRSESLQAQQLANRSVSTTADRLQQRLVGLLDTAQSVARVISGLDPTQRLGSEVCSAAMQGALSVMQPHMINFTVIGLDGRVMCSAVPVPPGTNVADRPHVQQALKTGRPALSGYTIGRVTRQQALQVVVPVLPAGESTPVALVVVALAAPQLTAGLVVDGDLPLTALVFDRDDVLLSRQPDSPAVERGRSYAGQPLLQALHSGAAASATRGLDGVDRVYALRTVNFEGQPALRVAVGLAVDAQVRAERIASWRDFGLVAALLLAVAMVASVLLRPVVLARARNLLAVARTAAAGDLRQRVPIGVQDELTPVEQAFNQMLGAIESERAELAASEDRYRQLYANNLDGVLQSRPNGLVLAANPAACRIFRCTEAEITQLGRGDLVDASDPRLLPLLERRERDGHAAGELTLRRPDGSLFEAEISSSVYQDRQGEPMSWIVLRDITDRKRAEQQLLTLTRELEDRVQLRTRELAQANRELEAFSYSVSHDLRSPVQAVQSFSHILENGGYISDDKGRHYLSRIRRAAERMGELIQGLLALAQLGHAALALQPVDLSALAAELAQELREAEPGRDVQLHIAPGLQATADPRLVRVVLQNLLGNAWKFTRQCPQPQVVVEQVTDDQGVTAFCVRDNGAGFDEAHASHLFGAFQRLHSEQEFPGIGVGLATVQRIVQRHGGRIWARAKPGAGAAFYWTLSA